MAKLEKHEDVRPGDPDVSFFCPGCKCNHGVWLPKEGWNGPSWDFNGNYDKPTFSPSLKVTSAYAGKETICHTFIRDGMIQFLPDCTHELAGQTVELEDIK